MSDIKKYIEVNKERFINELIELLKYLLLVQIQLIPKMF